MSEQFEITPEVAATVVVTTVCIYLVFILLVRLLGQRSLASMSSFDFGCVVALGGVLARTSLLKDPTLAIGAVALTTFFAMQVLLGLLRQLPAVDRLINRQAVLLVDHGVLLHDNMRAFHVVEDEIRQAVRRAGRHGLDDVRWVVLERNGAVSVIGTADADDTWLLADVFGGLKADRDSEG